MIANALNRWLPSKPDTSAETDDNKQQARESFTDFLPWMEYLADSKTFLLEDGISVGAVWEIDAIGTEGRGSEHLKNIQQKALNIIADTVPERDHNPWVLQVYVKDEPELSEFIKEHKQYRFGQAPGSQYTAHFDYHLSKHLKAICQPQGFFVEDPVTKRVWRGKQRRIRMVLFRRQAGHRSVAGFDAIEELSDLAAKLESALANARISAHRYTGKAFYDWMLAWFNPKPAMTDGDVSELAEQAAYPGDDQLPFGRDLAELMVLSPPYSDHKKGVIYFDGLPHSVITTLGLRRHPNLGHFTGEQSNGKSAFTVFDRMPEHTIMAMAITFVAQDKTLNHIQSIEAASVGDQTDAQLAAEQAGWVKRKIGLGDKLYPMELVFYVRGEDDRDLRRRTNQVSTVLLSANITPIDREQELLVIDRYLAMLPMCFRPENMKHNRRSRYAFASHLAAMLPVYGRTKGTGHPGITMFNRGAEPLTFDPLHRLDRKKNAHMLVIGPTGAGKSSTLVWLLMQMMAIYRPRLYIVEAGNSFGLLGEDFKRHGLDVYQASLNMAENVSLPPFADALKLVDQPLEVDPVEDDDDSDDEVRDILGEMEIAARLMITGGEDKEEARLTRSDRRVIREAIYQAAVTVQKNQAAMVKPEDVSNALLQASCDPSSTDTRRDRIREMADAIALFTDKQSLAGHLFNREGSQWPEADVTIVDLATLAREGYEGELSLAYTSLMNHINHVVEREQHDPRMTLVVTDEAHIITTNPLLARYVVKITKMWRKLGAWYWAATQNLEDFPDAAKRMLNMMEWWFCLVMPKEEVEQIARFKELSDEKKQMLLSATKEPGKFVEGVVLSDEVQTLFRVVPPAIALALAMTENEEKAERYQLMQDQGLATELDAAYAVAETIGASR